MLPHPLSNLMPQPRSLHLTGGVWDLKPGGAISVGGPSECLDPCLSFLGPDLVRPARADETPAITLSSAHQTTEGYDLEITSSGIRLSCAARNPHPALATLQQLLRLGQDEPLPLGLIKDAPALATRGFMLDVSRDRVPSMEQLHDLIRTLAGLKYNHLELYTEHTFAYRGHESVWRNASPLTADEVHELDLSCASMGINLVANQNCLGHMHRWLTLPQYKSLAEDPKGMEHAFSVAREPFSLCPTDPRSLNLATDLIDQLLACHQSRLINVGLDETFDVGQGRSSDACNERGKGRIYLEYLQKIHAHLESRGAQMLFWGDIICQHPELVPELPKNALSLLWGYEAGHPFDQQARLFADSGLDFWIVPGTSSWQSLLGRIDNARANLAEAAQAAVRHGAKGWMVADWGDFGHWQPWPISWPGLVLGAAEGWNPGQTTGNLASQIELAIPEARGHGQGIVALGQAHQTLDSPAVNGTSPFFHLRYAHRPLPLKRAPNLTHEGLARMAQAKIEALSLLPADTQINQELQAACALSGLGEALASARLGGEAGAQLTDIPKQTRIELNEQLDQVLKQHAAVWPLRSRAGGREDSLQRLRNISDLLN